MNLNSKPLPRFRLGLSAAITLLLSATGMAATVSITVNSNGGSPYATSTGSLLTTGSAIRVGFFNTFGAANMNTLMTSNVYSEVDALFTAFAEGHTNSGTVNQAGATGEMLVINDLAGTGHLLGQIINIDSTYCTPGDDMWVWAFNNADPLLATEWGIFSATTGWDFPAALGSATLSTFEVDTVLRGTNTGSQLQLSSVGVIPEPGSLLLIMAAGIVLRRRRL